jgi:hypothetical protein
MIHPGVMQNNKAESLIIRSYDKRVREGGSVKYMTRFQIFASPVTGVWDFRRRCCGLRRGGFLTGMGGMWCADHCHGGLIDGSYDEHE